MSFAEPVWLWLLVALPLLAALYGWGHMRRRGRAIRLASAPLLASVVPKPAGWRRVVVAALAGVALALLVVASAAPVGTHRVAREQATIVMAIDVSQSMRADDVEPSRIGAAQQAAKIFLQDTPAGINVGLVAFAGTAAVVVPPTQDRQVVAAAIDRLNLADATAIGEAIFAALSAFDTVAGGDTADSDDVPKRIVLLSDGTTTAGRPDAAAIRAANQAGVPVDTVAVGTKHGEVEISGQTIAVPVADSNLAAIAQNTDGQYFQARDSSQLTEIYERLGSVLGYTVEEVDQTHLWLRSGIGVLCGAMVLSLVWFGRAVG